MDPLPHNPIPPFTPALHHTVSPRVLPLRSLRATLSFGLFSHVPSVPLRLPEA